MSIDFAAVPVQVTVRGDVRDVPDQDRVYALNKIESVLAIAPLPVLGAHLVVGWKPAPAHRPRAHLEVGVDVNGVQVRAHIAADTVREGADLLQDRLRRRLVQMQDRSTARHHGAGMAHRGERHPADTLRRPTGQPNGSAGSAGSAEVLRRKSFALGPMSQDEAAYQMELLDHDFFLFTDEATGHEAVVHRTLDGDHVTLSTASPLSEVQARERLDLGGEAFVFYQDPRDGRGHIVYRRFDRHYGLISPA